MRALLSGLALLAALALAGCDPFGKGPDFSIVSGSENTVLQPIVEEFCKQKNATCTFKYEGTLDIGLALQSDQGVAQDAVWPASSVWVDMFDTKRRVKSLTSIAQTPVVLGVRKSKAEQLGWIGRDVFMKDILAAVENGSLKFLMTSATQSNSGASAYLAMLSSALGNKPVIEPGDLDDKGVQESVRSLLSGVVRSSGSSGWLADLYVESAGKGTVYDAMWNYEAVLKETNDKLAALSQEPLYAIYPADGVAMADSPLGFVDHGRGPEAQTFFKDLLTYLRSAPVQQRIADTGRRIPLSGVAAKPEPGWNFDPAGLVTAIRMPEPEVIRQALTLYQAALRKPSLTALCLDFSGSMQGDGEDQLQKAIRFLLKRRGEQGAGAMVARRPDHRHSFRRQRAQQLHGKRKPAGAGRAAERDFPAEGRRRHGHVCLRRTGSAADCPNRQALDLSACHRHHDRRQVRRSKPGFHERMERDRAACAGLRHHIRRRRQDTAR